MAAIRHGSLRGALAACILVVLLHTPAICEESPSDLSLEQMDTAALWQHYFGWRQQQQIEQAHRAALLLVERTAEAADDNPVDYGRALAELGTTELLSDRPGEALEYLHRSAALLADQLPIYGRELIVPLTYLGASLQSLGRHEEALEALTEAQHITHRQSGINNELQLRIVLAKANSFEALGAIEQAGAMWAHAVELQQLRHGHDSPQAIQLSADYGTWLRATGEYHGAISYLHDALSEIRDGSDDPPEAFPLMVALAHAYRGGYRGKYARGMYRRILEMMAAHPQSFSLEQHMTLRLDYADWLMQRYYERQAVDQYRAAWQLARDAGTAGIPWLRAFEQPALVRYGEMAPQSLGGSDQSVSFRFEVKNDGRPAQIDVIETTADKRARYDARKAFPKQVRFRPAIIDGEPVSRPGVELTMYLLPPGTYLESAPVVAPQRLTGTSSAPGLEFLNRDVEVTEAGREDPDNFSAFTRLGPDDGN